MREELLGKIESRTARIAVIGLGYVGLPLARVFCDEGFQTTGFDTDPQKIEKLRAGQTYLKHLGDGFAGRLRDSGRFTATTDFSHLSDADAILICVPTPLGDHQEPDLSYVEQTGDTIAATLRPGQLIVLESTTYPSTTRDLLLPRLAAGGLECGRDFFLAYSPEREDPGRSDQTTQSIPKLVGGIDPRSGEVASQLYRAVIQCVVPVSSAEVAESAKLLENIYRAVNIALVNELKLVMEKMGIDIWEVIDAAATKPFGFQPFYPGPGLGGHCIPIDPFYLAWKAREVGQPTRFIELAGQINHAMPSHVVERVIEALNERGKAVRGSTALVLGLAYKPDVDDVRESPSFEIITRLKALGAQVDYHDPHVPRTSPMRRYDLRMESIALEPDVVSTYDCVIIVTHHSTYDWKAISDQAQLVIDTRGVLRGLGDSRSNVVEA